MGLFEDFILTLQSLSLGNPILVIFVASLLGNMIPFFPVPYLIYVVYVAQTPGSPGLVQLATVGALGASIGKFVSYGLGYGAGKVFPGSRARFDSLRQLLGGSAFLAAFIFAASPFPDDVIFIPLGMMRYSPPKTFMSLFSGKFVLTLTVAYLARSSGRFLDVLLGGSPIAAAISVGIVLAIAVVMMKVDWEKVVARQRNGLIRRTLGRIKRRFRKPKTPQEQPSTAPTKPDTAAPA